MEFQIEKSAFSELPEISRAIEIVRKYDGFEELTKYWIFEQGKSLNFETSYDDDNQHTLLCITLKLDRERSQYLYVPLASVLRHYPQIQAASNWRGHDEKELHFERRNRRFDVEYHDDLMDYVIPGEQLVPFCLEYGISNIGYAKIEMLQPHEIEDFDDLELDSDEYDKSRFGRVLCTFQKPADTTVFDESMYFILPAALTTRISNASSEHSIAAIGESSDRG
jgi:hypothetical protein